MKAVVALIAVGLAGVASSAALPKDGSVLPSFVKTCARDQPDLDACLLSSLQKLQPYLVKGIPELDLPPFDPYREDEYVTEYENGFVELKATVRDFAAYGLTGLRFLGVRTNFIDEKDVVIEIDIAVPKVKSEGKYRVQGKFLGSDLFTRGSFELTMLNVTATWELRGSLETVDGERYLRIHQFAIAPEIGDMRIFASDLFNGNAELTKAALQLFNQNWRQVVAEVLPHSRGTWDKKMRDLANRVFLKVPFDRIFPVSS